MASLLRGLVRDYQERVLTGKQTRVLSIIKEPVKKRKQGQYVRLSLDLHQTPRHSRQQRTNDQSTSSAALEVQHS